MTSIEYQRTLSSPRWKALKWRRLLEAGFRCEMCNRRYTGKRPRSALKVFQLHHITYRTLGGESLDDVLIVCDSCHSWIHGKKPSG